MSVALLPAASRALAVMVPAGTALAGVRLQVPLVLTVVLPMMLLSWSRTVTTAPGSPVPLMASVLPPLPGRVMSTSAITAGRSSGPSGRQDRVAGSGTGPPSQAMQTMVASTSICQSGEAQAPFQPAT